MYAVYSNAQFTVSKRRKIKRVQVWGREEGDRWLFQNTSAPADLSSALTLMSTSVNCWSEISEAAAFKAAQPASP